jgi:hypothetical protein
MNAQTPFWPLVRNEIGIDRHTLIAKLLFGAYWIAAWWGTAAVPWGLLFGHKTATGASRLYSPSLACCFRV